jgi:hypothetical protein
LASGECIFDCTHDSDCRAGFGCSPRGRCTRLCEPTQGGQEICDAVDNDCDGQTDEELFGQACTRTGPQGTCHGQEVCQLGDWICDAAEPVAEECNAVDDDCDGQIDEELAEPACSRQNQIGTCFGLERCQLGQWVCDAPEPAIEDCNARDDNCDGATDEGLEGQACPLTQGVCQGATRDCLGAAGWSACDYGPGYQSPTETLCDGLDNDCDGLTDEDVEPLADCELGAQATDGLDNNCNGVADEPGGCMIRHPFLNLYVDTYENVVAEHADCSGPYYGQGWWDNYPPDWPDQPGPGDRSLYACSLPLVMPSGNATWQQARQACLAQGKRLCTKEEWSQACGGSLYLEFPYGQSYMPTACNTFSANLGDTRPTGSMPECVSEGGAYDMSGNLWEWVSNPCSFDSQLRGLQGGSWYCTWYNPQTSLYETCDMSNPDHQEEIYYRHHCGWPMNGWYCQQPLVPDRSIGFRCCWTPP